MTATDLHDTTIECGLPMQQILEQAPGYRALLVGPDLRFGFVNSAFRALVGGREIYGKPLREALPELEGHGYFELAERAYRGGEPCGNQVFQFPLRAEAAGPAEQGHAQHFVDFVFQPVYGSGGEIVGVACQGIDVTERVLEARAQAEALARERAEHGGLQLAAQHLREARRLAQIGTWEYRFRGRQWVCSDEVYRIFGLPRTTLTGNARDFWLLIHPKDRRACGEVLRRIIRTGEPGVFEHRVLRDNGNIGHVQQYATLLRDSDGHPLGLSGTILDVSGRLQADERLGRKRRLLRMAGRIARLGGWSFEPGSAKVDWSDEVCDIHEVPAGTTPSLETAFQFYAADSQARIRAVIERCMRDGTPFDEELQILTARGQRRWVRALGQAVRDSRGDIVRIEGALQDVSGMRAAQQALHESESRFREMAENIADVFYSRSPDASSFSYLSPAFEQIWGRSRSTVYERPGSFFDEVHPEDRPKIEAALVRQAAGSRTDLLYRLNRGDGRQLWIRDRAYPIRDRDGSVIRVVGTARDISAYRRVDLELQRERRKLAYIAHHDILTGVYNRAYLTARAPQIIAEARASGERLAIFFVDLDEFKLVNDSRGHRTGDMLLRIVAKRLRNALRPSDLIVRTGGDEFVAVMTHVSDVQQVESAAKRVAESMRGPIQLEDETFCVTVSIGVSVYPEDGTDLATLLRNADIALYQTKATGKDGYCRFTVSMHEQMQTRAALMHALQQAIGTDQLTLVYQPIVELRTGRTMSMEALLRWNHPSLGMIQPSAFIPMAEQSGLVNELGSRVLWMACRQLREWLDAGLPRIPVSVNISARQFERGELSKIIQGMLAEFRLEPSDLLVEITESAAMQQGEQTLGALNALRQLGVRIAIDDFGIGYSSLSYLRYLPTDTLKIDRSFVRGMDGSSEAAAIVAAIIKVAQTLGLKTVAEGVETLDQLEQLRGLGCDAVQGFYLSRPLSATACRSHLAQLAADNVASLTARRRALRLIAAAEPAEHREAVSGDR